MRKCVCVCVHVRECASTSKRCHQSSALRGHGGNASSPYRSFLREALFPEPGEDHCGKSNALPAGSTARLRIWYHHDRFIYLIFGIFDIRLFKYSTDNCTIPNKHYRDSISSCSSFRLFRWTFIEELPRT